MEPEPLEQQRRIYYELLQRVGNQGRYQVIAIRLFLLISLLGSSTFFIGSYLFYQQTYTCNGVQSPHCTNYVCSLPPAKRVAYESTQLISTLGNQSSQMLCGFSGSITIMLEALLIGASVGLLLGMTMSDILGRKEAIMYSIIMQCIGIFLIMVFQNIQVRCFGLIIWGSGAEISFVVAATYVSEIIAEQKRSEVYVKFDIAFAAGTMANTIVFYLLNNWMLVLGCYYLLGNVLTAALFYHYVQSPPIEIISKNKDPQFSYQAFMRIADRNLVVDHHITPDEIGFIHYEYHENKTGKERKKYFTFLDLFRYPSVRSNLFRVSFSFAITMFLLYGPAILMQQLFPNILLSGLINGLSQFSTIPFLHPLNTKANRRTGLMVMFAGTTVFTLLQFVLSPSGCVNCSSSLVATFNLVFFFIARFFINLNSNFFINTLNQSFPAQIRSVAYCSIAGVGRLSTLLIPFVPLLSHQSHLSENLYYTIIGFIGMLSCLLIRETLHIPLPEIIEELKNEKNGEGKQNASPENMGNISPSFILDKKSTKQ